MSRSESVGGSVRRWVGEPMGWWVGESVRKYLKGNQKGNIKCYARERANTKQPF